MLAGDLVGPQMAASHNSHFPQDVNRDHAVSPIDALLVVNRINQASGSPVGSAANFAVDVNADTFVSAIDALLVINYLNANNSSGSFGNSSTPASPQAGVSFPDVALREGTLLQEVPQGETHNWGINLNGNVDWNSMSAWVDMTNKFRRWGNVDAPWLDGGFTQPFTDQGLPTEDFGAFWLHRGDPLGIYNFRYEGTASVTFSGRASIVPGSVQTTAGVTTLQVNVSEEGDSWMGFHGVLTSDPIRNIKMVANDYPIDTTEVFRGEFKRRLSPFSTLRFMDWSQTNNSVVTSWADRRLPTEALQTPPGNGEEAMGGIAWEHMIQLANETQKDAWINVPHLANDNYIRELARLWRDNLDPNLKLIVEWSNETWNGIFTQSAGNGSDYYLPGNAGPETVRVSQIFRDEFAASPDRLHITLAGQSSVTTRISRAIEYMTDNSLVPTNVIDSISIAPYFAPPTQNGYSSLDDLFADMQQQTAGIQSHATLAQSLGVELLAYEAGQHLASGSSGLSEPIALSAQHDPRMAVAYKEFNDIWSAAGGGVVNQFAYIARGGKSGHWSLLESAGLPGSTKWDALVGLTMLPGDANIDHVVDMGDFTVLSGNYGLSSEWWEQGDFDGDQDVDSADLQAFYKHAQLTGAEDLQVRAFANANAVQLPYYVDISLATIPASPVTITIDGGTQLATSPISVEIQPDASALRSIRVEVIPVADFLAEGNHTGTLSFTASSADPNYDGIAIGDLTIDIIDNDPPDVVEPVATVDALPAVATTLSLPITVSFNDPQHPDYPNAIVSGVSEIDVFASKDSGGYQLWMTLLPENPNAIFQAESNHTYDFYAIARDHAGNQEAAPAAGAEAETSIAVPDLSAPEVEISAFDHFAAVMQIPVSATDIGTSLMQQIDLYASVDGGANQLVGTQSATGGSTQTATFSYTPLSDANAHEYTFTAVATDQAGNAGQVAQTRVTARLHLSVDASSIDENATTTATVTRNTDTSGDLVVQLQADKHHDASVPRTVVIPDGQSSSTFDVLGLDDHRVDGNQTVELTATMTGFQSSIASLVIVDTNEASVLPRELGLSVTEGANVRDEPRATRSNWGINLAGSPDWASSATWLDLTNKFRRWGDPDAPWADGGFTSPFTSQGLPTEDFGAYWWHVGDPTGIYNFRYEGIGSVTFDGAAAVVPGSQQTIDGVTTLQVNINNGGNVMVFRGVNSSDPVRNIRLVASDYDIDSQEVFRAEFKRRLAPFSNLRFMVWNETNNSPVTSWGERRLPTEALQSPAGNGEEAMGGIAWEYMIRLANETQKDAWINVPHQADDNYVRELAKLWRDNLDPNLKLIVEWSNETWNGIFTQSSGSGGDYYLPGNAGPETVRVSSIFHDVFAGEPDERLHVTIGGQSVVTWRIQRAFEYMLDNGLNPSEVVDSIAIAPYFAPPPPNSYTNLDALFADLEQQTQGIVDHAALALSSQVELIGYEAGQHLAADFSNLSPEIALAAQHDPRMGDAYREFDQIWTASGAGLVSQFAYIQGGSDSGHWSLLEEAGLEGSVKWDAMMGLTMLPGDVNIDHEVGIDDFTIIQANFGRTDAWWEQGDFDGDRDVDADDLYAFYKHAQLSAGQDGQVRTFAADQSIDLPVYVDIQLTSIPSVPLTIDITGGGQLMTVPASLSFAPDISALEPVRVEVVALDDTVHEGAHAGVLSYTITTADTDYSSLMVGSTNVPIVDNDLPDVTSPIANVSALPAVATSLTFPVSVTANDPANAASPLESISGVAQIAIFVATDDGPFTHWTSVTPAQPQADFVATGGHTYAFYSLAIDNAGNAEIVPPAGIDIEAGITVPDLSAPVVSIDSVDTSGDLMLINVTAEDVGGVLQSVLLSVTNNGSVVASRVAYAPADGSRLQHQFRVPMIADGTEHTYELSLVGTDSEGRQTPLGNAATHSVSVSKPAPSALGLLAVNVAGESKQRSYIQNIDLLFNTTSGLDRVATNGLQLSRFNTDGSGVGETVDISTRATASGQSIHIDFGSQGIGGEAAQTKGNGIYELRVDLDGDSIVDEVFRFFRLFGDTSGDGIVDGLDIANINAAYGRNRSNLGFDLDGNSRVDGRDRRAVLRNQGASVTGL